MPQYLWYRKRIVSKLIQLYIQNFDSIIWRHDSRLCQNFTFHLWYFSRNMPSKRITVGPTGSNFCRSHLFVIFLFFYLTQLRWRHTRLSERLESLGIMGDQLSICLKTLNTTVLWCLTSFRRPSIVPPWCRETPVWPSRVTLNWKKKLYWKFFIGSLKSSTHLYPSLQFYRDLQGDSGVPLIGPHMMSRGTSLLDGCTTIYNPLYDGCMVEIPNGLELHLSLSGLFLWRIYFEFFFAIHWGSLTRILFSTF